MDIVFETPRLLARPYAPGDWPHAHRIMSDPNVIWWRESNPMSEAETQAFHARVSGSDGAAATGFGWWLLFERTGTGLDLVGQAGLRPLDSRPGSIEIAYQLLPEGRGRGHATEGSRLLLKHGFQTKRLAEIIAIVRPDNGPSQRVVQRLGMPKTGTHLHAGTPHDLFVLQREDWLARR